MSNKDKITKYFEEVEKVFGTPESLAKHFELMESNEHYKVATANLSIGVYHKKYSLVVEVDNTELSSWVMAWLHSANNGGSIGGVRLIEVKWDEIDKQELKNKLQEIIDKL